ncbi:MAG: DUF5667 domain-containing protein [Candidatus Nealsonbacteria bacterium]
MTNKIKLFFTLAILGLILGNAINAQETDLPPEISDISCSLEEPCAEGLECFSFPEIGLRCAQSNPCSYYECPEDTQCFEAESYPVQIICSLSDGAENPEEITVSAEAQQEVDLDENIQPADLEINQPTILPDSPFYFFKNMGRAVRTFFTFDPVKKAELKEQFTSEKLMELKRMVEENKNANAIRNAAQNYQEELQGLKTFAERIKTTAQENEQVENFLDKYIQHNILHQRVLQKLETQVPDEVLEKIQQVRNNHLDRFNDIMIKLEDKDKIPERLEKNLNAIKGSDFKDFKNLEILDDLKEKLPEDIRDRIEERKDSILNNLREKLENLPEERRDILEEYIEKISGDKIKQLDILSALEGTELSNKLKAVIERAQEVNVQRIESQHQNIVTKEKVEFAITQATDLLAKVKSLIVEKNTTAEEIPEIFRLIEEAEEKLEAAKTEFDQENYSRAYSLALASSSLSRNAIRIMEIRAGFKEDETNRGLLICADIVSPVCAKDGRTYKNICEAKKAEAVVVYRGECKTNLVCAQEGEQINRNPLLGPAERRCCEGLEEIRVSRTYSICKQPGASFECKVDSDCPLPRCLTTTATASKCVEGKCILPVCYKPEICIQVITPARNSKTGECRNFPTPCDVPAGWERTAACKIPQLLEIQK